MAILKLDELNTLKSEDYETYFSKMNISQIAKEKRIQFAKQFEDIFLEFLESLYYAIENHVSNLVYIEDSFMDSYLTLLALYMVVDSDMVHYADSLVDEMTQTTIKNSDMPYMLSEDRARFVSENEANTALNYADYKQAVARGFKHKVWNTMKDKNVRKTHKEIEGMKIGIDDWFSVGKAVMLYPKDVVNGSNHPEEIVNCRCSVTYTI